MAAKSYISKVKIPNNTTTFYLRDSEDRIVHVQSELQSGSLVYTTSADWDDAYSALLNGGHVTMQIDSVGTQQTIVGGNDYYVKEYSSTSIIFQNHITDLAFVGSADTRVQFVWNKNSPTVLTRSKLINVPSDAVNINVTDSDSYIPTSKAVKTYVDNTVSSIGTPLDFRGVTNVQLTDGSATPSTYQTAGLTPPPDKTATDTLKNGTVAIYGSKEFVWDGSKWHEFGSAQISGDTAAVIRGDAVLATPSTTATLGTPTRTDVVSGVTFSSSTSTGATKVLTGWTDPPLRGVNFNAESGNAYVSGVASSGTVNAVTSYTPTSLKLDVTQNGASKITSNTPVAFKPVSAVTNGTFSDYVASSGSSPTWSFTVSNETLTISGANGSIPTFNTTAGICKNVTAGSQVAASIIVSEDVNIATGTASASGTGQSVLTGLGAPATTAVIKSNGLTTKYASEMSGVSETYTYITVSKTSGTNSPIKTAPSVTVPAMTVSKSAGSGQSSATVNAYVDNS